MKPKIRIKFLPLFDGEHSSLRFDRIGCYGDEPLVKPFFFFYNTIFIQFPFPLTRLLP
jgi:hypothetical protein